MILDMDGVLVDNMMTHMEAFTEIARRYGVKPDIPSVLAMAGKGNPEIFEEIFPADIVAKVGLKELVEENEAIYRELYAPKLKPAKGLIEFLDSLKANGIKIAVGTSASKANLNLVLDGIGIRKYFDTIVHAEMVTRCKPDPEIYLVALRELGLGAAECVVFEDAVAGIQAARRAGIKVVAVATSAPKQILEAEPGVVRIINDFTEINIDALKVLI